MNIALALTVAVLFGVGNLLVLRRNLIDVAAGTILMSNASLVFILATGKIGAKAPILPLPSPDEASDPLVQALALTAMVINFGVSFFLLALVHRFYRSHGSLDPLEHARALKAEKKEGDEAP